MIEVLAGILFIVLASRVTEEYTGIPINLPLITFSFFLSAWFPELLAISRQQFDEILIMLLPVILFPDVINLSLREVRDNALPIAYLALLGVGVSLLLAVLAGHWLYAGHGLSSGELACLFAPLLATDAITVTSMAGKFDLPERLKLIAEGESLFNDATALIAFFFVAVPLLTGGDVQPLQVSLTLLAVLVFSVGVGALVALAGFLLLKLLRDPIEQFSSAFLVAVGAFLAADRMHLSGILAILASLMLFRVLIDKEVKRGMIFNYELHDALTHRAGQEQLGLLRRLLLRIEELLLRSPALSAISFRAYRKEAIYVGMFANAVLFILIAQVVDGHQLLRYWREIVIALLLTTGLRFALVGSLALLRRYPLRWVNALTLSGMKGGLAIIMIHSLPAETPHRAMLEAIVVGVVIASIFLYTGALLLYLQLRRAGFQRDLLAEAHILPAGQLVRDLQEVVERDPVTHIYHQIKFHDLLRHEILRAQRYKTPLGLLLIEFVNFEDIRRELGEEKTNALLNELRAILSREVSTLDIIGRLAVHRAAVLTINRTPEEDLCVAERLQAGMQRFARERDMPLKLCFALASWVEGDTPEMLLEKAHEALQRAHQQGCGVIGIAL